MKVHTCVISQVEVIYKMMEVLKKGKIKFRILMASLEVELHHICIANPIKENQITLEVLRSSGSVVK